MKKRKLVSATLSAAMLASTFTGFQLTVADAASWSANTTGTPQYMSTQRQMEQLSRGLIASYVTADNHAWSQNGVYLSWRLLGDESLSNQAFDIYRNGTKIKTTGAHDATNYFDASGSKTSQYIVVKAGESITGETAVTPTTNYTAKGSEVTNGNSEINSFTYVDIPIDRPDPVTRADGKTSYYYSYDSSHEGGANDASVGDLDGDGDYEIVLKWDPTDSKDSAGADYTGRVYIDGYEIDPNNGGRMWRIDLGPNVTAGAHYTQFIVFDFDGDGKSEIAMQTAPGTVDGQGNYVSAVGDTDEIRNVDNEKLYIGDSTTGSGSKGKNLGPEYYTIFEGETGKALYTTAAIPLVSSSYWGDNKYNRSSRFLAGVAYLDGVHPSLIECRGYYKRAMIRAYSWDGDTLTQQWEYNSGSEGLYGQGNHNLSIGDIDNDGKDEIVYGSAALDDDGKTVLGNTGLGHGDAMHMNDFNNDGTQEVFSVKEESGGYKKYAMDLRVAATGKHFWDSGKLVTSSDNGRGVMDNIDDDYASTHSNALAIGWDSGHDNSVDLNGDTIGPKPTGGSKSMTNFLVYWDGDLGRELLDGNLIAKYHADGDNSYTRRFYGPSDGYSLTGGAANNYTKYNPSLCADIWGDWREEVILPINKSSSTDQAYLRIYTSTLPTDYRLTTLMHDSQYRCSVAWQNVAYNQPTHQSYYIGSAALAKDSNGNKLNYLAPATLFTNVAYDIGKVDVTGVSLSDSSVKVEKGQSISVTANLEPSDATRKGITWTSSDDTVATVSNGTITGVNPGTATITATTRDGGYTAKCSVTVWSTPVTGVSVDSSMSIGVDCTKQLSAVISPADASDQTITWSSSNPLVAEVDDEGNVTGKTAGAVYITATTDEGGFTSSCLVNVTPLVKNDYTGDDKFVTTNTDSETVLSNVSASSATMTQTSAAVGGEFHKNFAKLTENKAVLNFQFTTGGQKDSSGSWSWTDREYTLNVALLGEDGQNILTLAQPYESSGAGTLTSKVGNNDTASFNTAWSSIVDGLGQIQGSTKRWIVNVEFDYDNDSATATITGTDSTWETVAAQYTMSFELGGLSLEQLKVYTTVDGSGAITAKPQLANLSYYEEIPAYGATSTLYEKNTLWYNAWESNDLSDWTQTGAALALDSDNGRIYFNNTKPTSAYSASKTFDIDNNAVVTYDVDWYFGNATGRLSNKEYIQFGNKLRLGWSNSDEGGYSVLVSTDGGESYNGVSTVTGDDGSTTTTVDDTKKLFTGSNTQYTKHVQVIFDVASKTIKSLKFDGTTVADYTNYALSSDAEMNSISFGLERGGGTSAWEYLCGLDSILVSQFVEGAEPVAPTAAPTATPTPVPTAKPTATPTPTPSPSPTPTPIPNEHNVTSFTAKERVTVSAATGDENEITFTNASNANNVYALAFADISSYIAGETNYSVEFDSYVTSGSRARIALVDTAQRPGNSSKNSYDTSGVAFVEGRVDSSSYTVNESKATYGNASGAVDTYIHTKIDVDTSAGTVSYKITDAAGSTLLSKSNVAYLNDVTINGIEYLDIVNSTVATMKNVKVITYTTVEVPTDTPSPSPTATTVPTDTPSPSPTSTSEPTQDVSNITVSLRSMNGIEATVSNNSDNDQSFSLIVASYDENGKLIGVRITDGTAAAGNSAAVNAGILYDDEAFSYCKAMVWDNMLPLSSVYDSRTEDLPESIELSEESETSEASDEPAVKAEEIETETAASDSITE